MLAPLGFAAVVEVLLPGAVPDLSNGQHSTGMSRVLRVHGDVGAAVGRLREGAAAGGEQRWWREGVVCVKQEGSR